MSIREIIKKSKSTIADLIAENTKLKEAAVEQALLDSATKNVEATEAKLRAKYIVEVEKEHAPWLEALEKKMKNNEDYRKSPAYNGKILAKVSALVKDKMALGV